MQCPICTEEREGIDRFCGGCGYDYTLQLPDSESAFAQPIIIADANVTSKPAKRCACVLPDVSSPDADGYCANCGIVCLVDVPEHVGMFIDDTLAVVSDIGRRHKTNEDCGTIFRLPNGDAVLVVSDGVSTSIRPTDASNTITRVIKDFFLSNTHWGNPADVMFNAIAEGHNTVARMTPRGARGAEATVVAAWVHDGKITYGWVGDSRIYTLDGKGLTQLTRDDSWIEDVVDAGTMSREDANKDPMAHAVTQVLGMKDSLVDIHVAEVDLAGPTKLLLCTDGLWNYYQEQAMCDLMSNQSQTTALAMCDHYVNCANEAGGTDNITAAVLLIK
jgi:PPM family protein phosphatase